MTDTMTPGRALAQWWAEQLGAQPFSSAGDGEIDMMLAMTRPRGGALAEEQTAKFVDFLAAKVDESLKRSPDYGVMLSTDYSPEGALVDAAEHAEISFSRFPIKTLTNARPDFVTVALGYGAGSVLIWSREGWERGACNTQNYVTDHSQPYGYRKLPEKCGLPRFHEEREHGSWIPMTDEELAR
jgi:hypothetical protein